MIENSTHPPLQLGKKSFLIFFRSKNFNSENKIEFSTNAKMIKNFFFFGSAKVVLIEHMFL